MDTLFEQLEQKLGSGRIKQKKEISVYFTLRTKTTAEYFMEAETEKDLENAVKATNELHIPLFMLGGGSNMAVFKDEIVGLVVRNLYQKFEVINDQSDYAEIIVSSGYPISRLIVETTKKGFEGFEYQLGLPGTLGGGIYMNSKWTHPQTYMGDNLTSAKLITKDGEIKEVDREYFRFAYDYSILQETHEIVVEAKFKLKKNDPEELKKRGQEALAYRKKTQPFGVATSGCFFQNISEQEKNKLNLPTASAGFLIDQAGLKNLQVGDFVVSDIHANFIINKGNGTPKDLIAIIQTVKSKIKEKYGVDLIEEVRLIN